ncbi:MAG: prolyl oligopeptidase family serine peptidase [Chitinophagaceae bacterium]
MLKHAITILCVLLALHSSAQKLDKLTVEKIMRDPKWIGSSPSGVSWSNDGSLLYFLWNPEKAPADSFWYISTTYRSPIKASVVQKQSLTAEGNYNYNEARTAYVYSKDGDIIYKEIKSRKQLRITQTTDNESNPQFCFSDTRIVYTRNSNLYTWDISTGETIQLTNVRTSDAVASTTSSGPPRGAGTTTPTISGSQQEQWLKNDQLQYFQVLKERKEKKDLADAYTKSIPKPKELRSINIEDKSLQSLAVSPDGRFVSYRLFKAASGAKTTIVPGYVTETGFTTDIPGRTKVGSPQGSSEFFIYDRVKDTVWNIKTDSLPGIQDLPDYVKDYPKQVEEKKKKPANRAVFFGAIAWSPRSSNAVLEIRSQDNKDRWLMRLDTATGKLNLLDRQRDEAWIGGPGTGGFGGINTGWLDENTFWYRSEATGYSHLYTVNVLSGEKKSLTKGNYEVQQAQLSKDKKYFYISTNEVHPGELQFYRLTIADGKKEKITTMTGSNEVTLSPDEKWLAIRYSYSNKPWELYLQENLPAGKQVKPAMPIQITNISQTEEFRSYAWRDPELISFPARDGALVYARLYKPGNPDPHKPAVLFVHGAGYLQNAHKWWSSYYREYMFNNMLADNGYYVMDIDYRGSAGYGRDWRTGIYRHMGGKDLSDNVDAVNYLVKNFAVNPKNVGLYGGSYGGFITLMGLFTEPDVFTAGAALRPVTDWANYNHGYTSNILNEPFTDSLAYRRSSPYYFAEGLKGHLLICHGMVDVNVHFQDAVKLAQRLIELGKDNWEIAPYPMEDHAFVEPSSWTDEYKRIFKLFETVLKK